MLKWDYKVIFLGEASATAEGGAFADYIQFYLQPLGAQGWELVSVVQWIAIFKRQSLTQAAP